MFDLSLIILSWNEVDVTLSCCESALVNEGTSLQRIVVDNGSDPAVVESLATGLEDQGECLLIRSPSNGGYGAGMNMGATMAEGEVLVFANNDLTFSQGALDLLLSAVRDAGESAVCYPLVIDADGMSVHGGGYIPTLRRLAGSAIGLHILLPRLFALNSNDPRFSEWTQGVCLAMSRTTYDRIGGFSEVTFMYSEDIRLGVALLESNGKLSLVPRASVIHLDDFSANKIWDERSKSARKSFEFVRVAAEINRMRSPRLVGAFYWAICARRHVFHRSAATRGYLDGANSYLASVGRAK